MKQFIVAACVAAYLTAGSALAQGLFSNNLMPTLSVGLQFGGSEYEGVSPLRAMAQFDLRSQLMKREPDLMTGPSTVWQIQSSALTNRVPLLTVFQFGASRNHGLELASVLGHDMLQSGQQLNEAGEAESGHSWMWWVGGAVVAGAVAAVSASGGHGSSSNSAQPSSSGCNGVQGQKYRLQEIFRKLCRAPAAGPMWSVSHKGISVLKAAIQRD